MSAKVARPRKASTLVRGPKGPQRKALATVDTTLASYSRTEPFEAFNTLLKLIGALPSRVGAAQYKLTPDEHALTVHLLAIVEPFLSTTPEPRRTITRQPTELLDTIVGYLDAPADLRALALTCRRFHAIVVPRHAQYRVVRAPASALRVWHHLATQRGLAANVRVVEVLDERVGAGALVVPAAAKLMADTDLESTDDELARHDKQGRFLLRALAKMVNLTEFMWSSNHSPSGVDDVWPTLLKHCLNLRQVRVQDNLIFAPVAEEGEEAPSQEARQRLVVTEPLVKLVNVKKVAIESTKYTFGAHRTPALCRARGLLDHCPNLESLSVAYTRPRASTTNGPNALPDAGDFLLYSRWPQLADLSLARLHSSSFDAFSSFLTYHSKLSALHLDGLSGAAVTTLDLPAGALPCLRELHAPNEVALAVLASGTLDGQPHPLETLKGIRVDASSKGAAALCQALREYGLGVRHIELAGYGDVDDIRRLAKCAPGVVWLDVGRRLARGRIAPVPATPHKGEAAPPVSNTTEWASALAAMPDIVRLHGVRFFYEVSQGAAAANSAAAIASGARNFNPATMNASISMTDRSRLRKNDEVAGMLAWKCPKLRRLDHWEEGGGRAIILARDGERVRWEVRRLPK
ncbi:hypothetical protein EV714DRAFT_210650 [Schizophyllum commune]